MTTLSVSPPRPSVARATYLRRRLAAVILLLVLAFVLTVALGRVGAQADLEDRVVGHAVVEPGGTLWEIAAATAPDGVDVRRHLADIQELNGLDGQIDAWTVVLIPGR